MLNYSLKDVKVEFFSFYMIVLGNVRLFAISGSWIPDLRGDHFIILLIW